MNNTNDEPKPIGDSDLASVFRAGLEARRAAAERAQADAGASGKPTVVTQLVKPHKPDFDGIKVRGRGFIEPYLKTLATEAGLMIRVDCATRSEEWVELNITPADLCELLGSVLASQPRGYGNVLVILDRVQEDLRK